MNSDEEWQPFMRQFADSIRHIVHDVDKVISRNGQNTAIEDELESLRSKVDELTEEVNISCSQIVPVHAYFSCLAALSPAGRVRTAISRAHNFEIPFARHDAHIYEADDQEWYRGMQAHKPMSRRRSFDIDFRHRLICTDWYNG